MKICRSWCLFKIFFFVGKFALLFFDSWKVWKVPCHFSQKSKRVIFYISLKSWGLPITILNSSPDMWHITLSGLQHFIYHCPMNLIFLNRICKHWCPVVAGNQDIAQQSVYTNTLPRSNHLRPLIACLVAGVNGFVIKTLDFSLFTRNIVSFGRDTDRKSCKC